MVRLTGAVVAVLLGLLVCFASAREVFLHSHHAASFRELQDASAGENPLLTSYGSNTLSMFLAHAPGAVGKNELRQAIRHPLTKYVPHDTYVVTAEEGDLKDLRTSQHVSLAPVTANMKVSPTLRNQLVDSQGGDVDVLVVLNKDFFELSEDTTTHDVIAELGLVYAASHTMRSSVSSNAQVNGLAQHPAIEWVQEVPHYDYQNKHGRRVIQSSKPEQKGKSGMPFWDMGLRGDGELIGCADSGIDVDHCFFHDDKHSVEVGKVNPMHRKIHAYFTVPGATFGDFYDGHGTHVTGTIAGCTAYPTNSTMEVGMSHYNGVAEHARLVFTGVGTPEGGIIIPEDLKPMLNDAYSAGARIHTNSWTAAGGEYNTASRDIDEFSFDKQTFLVLFAAGNAGQSGLNTVGVPSNAKNCLTVGATESTPQSFLDYADFNLAGQVASVKASLCENNFQYFKDSFCSKFGLKSPCLDELQPMLCSNFTDVAACCKFPVNPDKCCPDWIREKAIKTPLFDDIGNLAPFSSRGPIKNDGRLKPDVVAPGAHTISSKSDGRNDTYQCNPDSFAPDAALVPFDGTSMATPLVAGATAIARQFYQQGRHTTPDGSPNIPELLDPSAALLKATIIASAEPISLLDADETGRFTALDPPPSVYQGYGRVTLDRILKHPGARFETFVSDWKSVQTGQHEVFCVTPTTPISADASNLEVTLVWTDAPAHLASSRALVNNLDLVLVDARGREYHSATGEGGFDQVNNVERVVLPSHVFEEGSQWQIIVSGTDVPVEWMDKGQPFALVVRGSFKIGEEMCHNTCPMYCNGNGQCDESKGTCTCDDGWFGPDCSLSMCPNSCSGKGSCNGVTGACVCDEGWGGPSCEERRCPKNCNGHGECDVQTGKCDCEEGYIGESCTAPMCPYSCSGKGKCLEGDQCRCDDTRVGIGCCIVKKPLEAGERVTELLPQYSPYFIYVTPPAEADRMKVTMTSSGGGPILLLNRNATIIEKCELNICTDEDFDYSDTEISDLHTIEVDIGESRADWLLAVQNEGTDEDDTQEEYETAAVTIEVTYE